MALASGVGVFIEAAPPGLETHAALFGEDQARYLLALPASELDTLDEAAEAAGAPYQVIGRAGGCEVALGVDAGGFAVDLDDIRALSEDWLPRNMGGEPAAA